MKKLYLLAAGLAIFSMTSAQTNALKSNLNRQKVWLSSTSANKPTTTLSRLIANASSNSNNGNLELKDSSIVNYTGDRGYDEQLEQWKFDNSFTWDFENGKFVESIRTTRTFNGAGRIATIKGEYKDGSNWVLGEIERFTYTPIGLIDTYVYADYNGTYWDSTRTVNLYNSAGKSLGDLNQTWEPSSNSWVNDTRNRIILNSGNEPDSSIFEDWDASTGTWEATVITKYTYSSGKLANTVTHLNMNGTWTNGNRVTYTYHANGKVLTELYESWDAMLSSWKNENKATYTYNSSNLLTKTFRERYMNSNWENDRQTDYTYNNFGQILVETEQLWFASKWNLVYQGRNYYETYFPASVNDVASQSQLKLYPVPARDRVNLQIGLEQPATVMVTIQDMTGKTVKFVNLPTVSQYNGYIDVAALPAGSYTVKMTGAGAPVIQKLNIVR